MRAAGFWVMPAALAPTTWPNSKWLMELSPRSARSALQAVLDLRPHPLHDGAADDNTSAWLRAPSRADYDRRQRFLPIDEAGRRQPSVPASPIGAGKAVLN